MSALAHLVMHITENIELMDATNYADEFYVLRTKEGEFRVRRSDLKKARDLAMRELAMKELSS